MRILRPTNLCLQRINCILSTTRFEITSFGNGHERHTCACVYACCVCVFERTCVNCVVNSPPFEVGSELVDSGRHAGRDVGRAVGRDLVNRLHGLLLRVETL